MINMLTAFTEEIDDAGVAVSQVLSQLNLKNSLLRHAAGIIQCSSFFVESGVVRELCAALPFAVVGCTTLGTAVRGAGGTSLLTLCVLTSDDVAFAAGASEPIHDCLDEPVERLYAKLAADLPEKPALLFLYDLFAGPYTGEAMLRKLSELADNVPFFGMRGFDCTGIHAAFATICNGEVLPRSIALLAMAGNVEPVFLLKTAAEVRMFEQHAVITAAEGNRLRTVNDVPATEYFASFGLVRDGVLLGTEMLLFVLNSPDGVLPHVSRVYAYTEGGDIVCGGEMPVGATFAIAILDQQYILSSARELASEASHLACGKNVLFTSCTVRSWALGLQDRMEMEILAGYVGETTYMLSYSAGEYFPFRKATGEWVQQFHNAALMACIF